MSDGNKKEKSHQHQHHQRRQRKKEQFLEYGISTLPPHEILEILLYYAIPRKDTNDIAHTLLKRFDNSLIKVIDADYDELTAITGIGENAASLICFFRMFAQLYLEKKAREDLLELFNLERLKEYCIATFVKAVEEEIHCLCFTDTLKLISSEKITGGTVDKVNMSIHKIAKAVLSRSCGRVVIAHNHPTGTCMPSRVDVDATIELHEMLARLDIELIDHIIVGRDGVLSMKENGYWG